MNLLTAIAFALLILCFVELVMGIITTAIRVLVKALRPHGEGFAGAPERGHLFHGHR